MYEMNREMLERRLQEIQLELRLFKSVVKELSSRKETPDNVISINQYQRKVQLILEQEKTVLELMLGENLNELTRKKKERSKVKK